MSEQLPQILSCSYGSGNWDLLGYTVQEEPVVKEGLGRVYTNVTVTAECQLVCQTLTAYNQALAAIVASARVDGRDFIVTGLNGTPEYGFLAAQCMDGGPHIKLEIHDSAPPMVKLFRLTLKSQRFDGGSTPTNSYKVSTQTHADSMVTVTRSGEVTGPNSTEYYLGSVLPAAQTAYPLPMWALEHSFSQDGTDTRTQYEIRVVQCRQPLPNVSAAAGSISFAVDGEITNQADRDEQFRLVSTLDVDLMIEGDPQAFLTYFRKQMATVANGPPLAILKERWSVTTIKEQRLRGSFVTLTSADSSPLLSWTETTQIRAADQGYEVKTYPGSTPVVVARPVSVARITQSGSASAIGHFKTVSPLFPNSFLEAPEITFEDVNAVEKRSSWRYVMYPAADQYGTPDGKFDPTKFDPSYMFRARQPATYQPMPGEGGNS